MNDINSSFGKGSVTRLGSAGGALVYVFELTITLLYYLRIFLLIYFDMWNLDFVPFLFRREKNCACYGCKYYVEILRAI